MKLAKLFLSLGGASLMTISTATAFAQTERALERRVDRNQRQLQRQANRTDYYTAQTWELIDPWVQQHGVAPLARAANAVSAVGNAVGQSVDAATALGDGQYGYSDKSPQQAWFYDYYTYAPTRYTPQGEDRYSSAVRYFDNDGDGVYESQSFYRDSDSDGNYDEFDRLDFYSQANVGTQPGERQEARTATATHSREDDSLFQGPRDARRHKVSGEIVLTKISQVNRQENLVVGLKHGEGQTLALDLGPAQDLQGKHVEVGAKIEAIGSMQTVGEKELLVVDSVRIGEGKELRIERGLGQANSGEIVDIKKMQIGSGENYLAVVTIDGEPQLVDLGPITAYKASLKPSTKIMVQGIPVRSGNHRVIMAEQVKLGDQVIEVKRAQSF